MREVESNGDCGGFGYGETFMRLFVENERRVYGLNLSLVRLVVGDGEIGNWGRAESGDRNPLRSSNGRIDEFALFERALRSLEFKAMYDAGRL